MTDFLITKHETGLYKNGFTIKPQTDLGNSVCKRYKGVIMNKFFIPNSMIDSFKKLAKMCNATLTEC